MTETEFLEQAAQARKDLDQKRFDFMADDTPVTADDIPKLLEIGAKLREADTSLNVYELYKHPETRAKLFAQITEACYMILGKTPTKAQRLNFGEYLEGQFKLTMKKLISQTDTQALGELMAVLDLDEVQREQFAKDMAVSGLLARNEVAE